MIEWIPEEEENITEIFESKPPKIKVELPVSTIDKHCRAKYGHANWERMDRVSPLELAGNPHVLDHKRGIIFFKKPHRV